VATDPVMADSGLYANGNWRPRAARERYGKLTFAVREADGHPSPLEAALQDSRSQRRIHRSGSCGES
jgi:hypothetical protein